MRGSELYEKTPEYWTELVKFARHMPLARTMRALTIMGRSETENTDLAKLLYPAMQAMDIRFLDVDVAHSGMDQRKIHMLVRDVFPKMGWKVPVAVHHSLLPGLSKPAEQDAAKSGKMSKSNPDSGIFMHDDAESIRSKIKSGSYTINSAGATFPYPLIDLWRVEIAKETSENLQLNYQSIGSGGGVQQHIAKTVNFAATDAPLKISEAKLTPGTLHIPETIGGVVVAYNIPEIPNSGLKLDGDTLAKIYLGEITKWNDESIAKNNPDQNLPDEKIVPVRRSDGSGTTFVFTDYLTAVSSEFDVAVGKGKSVQWPARTHGAAGNEGVAGIIRSTEYTIGYVELAYAFQTGMSYAYVQNGDGTAFVEPTLDSISAASQNVAQALPEPSGDWSEVSLVNTPGDNSYPIASFTYLLVYDEISKTTKSKEQAQALIYMIYWMLTSGQSFSPDLLYVPIPDAVADIGKDALSQITYEGETLWNYNPTPEVKLPDWFRTIAQFWIDGKISDSEYINNLQYLISNGILQVD